MGYYQICKQGEKDIDIAGTWTPLQSKQKNMETSVKTAAVSELKPPHTHPDTHSHFHSYKPDPSPILAQIFKNL